VSDKTILVIDDSATIRKLVDTHLSPCGYQVVLAPNAEVGLALAAELHPDLILLDHQLPGTTGFEVASQLEQSAELGRIPVVISSTLRKKAYAEYVELDNVVDMLPKPYTEDLLRTTVANALETAAMIVSSQAGGTAVPEVIGDVGEAALAGSFSLFGLREVIDFLNNGGKSGTLEVEAERTRLWIQLHDGRIQGVSATGLSDRELTDITNRLPPSLANLAPILKMTIGGQSCAEVSGFVQLLDQKVLDPRLLSKLLRFQSAMLIRLGFTRQLTGFRFETNQRPSTLANSLPLSISLLALLVEGALYSAQESPDAGAGRTVYTRRSIRGQNLDRAGLSARHMKILNLLATPCTAAELADQLQWDVDEVTRVLEGFSWAELIDARTTMHHESFVVLEPDPTSATEVRQALSTQTCNYDGKVIRDRLALQLILKRSTPNCLFFAADSPAACQAVRELHASGHPAVASIRYAAMAHSQVGDGASTNWQEKIGFIPDDVISKPCTGRQIQQTMERLFNNQAPKNHDAPTCVAVPSQVTTACPASSRDAVSNVLRTQVAPLGAEA